MTDVHNEVREKYASAARAVIGTVSRLESPQEGSCGGDACCGGPSFFGPELYDMADRSSMPDGAVFASLGCGNPTAVAELREGETVLDLGSGGGIDVLLSASRVGPEGKVYGLDMTDEMLALALDNKEKASARNVEFLKGYIEQVPLPAGIIDVVISNCVINLAADKGAVFAEMFRVLRSGGRIGITDVVAADHLSPSERADRGSRVECIAGALSFQEYEAGLGGVGFESISISSTHEVAEGMHSAIVKATKPAAAAGVPRSLRP